MNAFLTQFACALLLVAAMLGTSGCSSPESPESQVKTGDATSAAELKQWLNLIVESGEGGSAFEGLEASIDKIEVDAAVKESLKQDLTELLKARTPNKIKEIAKRMDERL